MSSSEADAIRDSIAHYLLTGKTDPMYFAWSGRDYLAMAGRARHDLRSALVSEVDRRTRGLDLPAMPSLDVDAFTRKKVEPMVRGLFPPVERPIVLDLLARSVVFVTRDNIAEVIHAASFDSSAWTIANLHLASAGAELLGPDASRAVGVSINLTSYVSPEYFCETDPFADFVVHESAHVLHDCKRRLVGLRATRKEPRLLEIDYRKRETFAYSCEAFSRVLERSSTRAERLAQAEEYAEDPAISHGAVDVDEVARVVCEAARARNGWKWILASCRAA